MFIAWKDNLYNFSTNSWWYLMQWHYWIHWYMNFIYIYLWGHHSKTTEIIGFHSDIVCKTNFANHSRFHWTVVHNMAIHLYFSFTRAILKISLALGTFIHFYWSHCASHDTLLNFYFCYCATVVEEACDCF